MIGTPQSDGEGLRIFLLHHTHWDREWWTPFQASRVRLVEVIDELLEALEADPEFHSFLLDSQTIVLRDYLEIRPENRDNLVHFIKEGRIQCGPWYVLADEFLVSGEAHIRNLWLGRRVANDLDCPILAVGYLPDTFGHIAQMPQILRGFGIDSAFLWRGRGGDPGSVKQEFLWESPDGSALLAHWFPDGYYQMPFLHFDNPARPDEDKLGRIHQAIERLGARATTDVLLLPYGGDYRPVDLGLPAKVALANQDIKGLGVIRWSTIGEYLAAVREQNPWLDTVRGELRGSGADCPYLLPGVLSARLNLKRMNFWCQTWLERYAEPLSAIAWTHGRRYDAGLLWKAWEVLVQNHPHDSICGCSIDQVHREMVTRFDESLQIAQVVSERCAQYLNERIEGLDIGPGERALVAFNPLIGTRSDWTSVWIPRTDVTPRTHRLVDWEGKDIPFQVGEVEGSRPLLEGWEYTEIGFIAHDAPGLGLQVYRLIPREAPVDSRQNSFTTAQTSALLKGGGTQGGDLAVGAGALENRFLRVEVDAGNGTLTVTDKISGEVYRGLNALEDGGDAGDAYNYSAPLSDMVLRSSDVSRVHVSVAEAGHARSTLRIDLDWALPVELSADRLSRSSRYVETRISTYVTLYGSSPDASRHARRVDITTEWENRSKDHRLRALFPAGVDARFSHARGPFEVARRPVGVVDPGNGWPEPAVPTLPQQGWVAVEDGGRGLMIASRGLPEFEVLDDGRGTMALTLLRAFGWVSREDLLARMGGAGPATPAPDAQSLGPNRASYAIIPYSGDWIGSRAYLIAEGYLAPLYGSAIHSRGDATSQARNRGLLPWTERVAELSGEHTLLLSACKRSERGAELILRFWNVAPEPTEARLWVGARKARLVDLKEEPLDDEMMPADESGCCTLRVGPAQIATVALW